MSTKSDQRVEEDIQHLKEWLQKQPHLPQDIDKRKLTAYVLGSKSMERAKEKLESYFVWKSKMPYYFSFPGRDPESPAFKRGCEALKLFVLPNLTPEGYTIVMCVFDLDISKFDHSQLIARMTMLIDLAMMEQPEAQGVVFICDSKGIDASILTKINISACALFFPWFEKTVPIKLKKIIYFNSPKLMDFIVNTWIKPFLSQKICSRMVITTGDVSITQETFPECLLPCDYGGLEKSSTDLNNLWLEKFRKNRDWFEKTNEQVVDDTKRLPDLQNTYGVNGTFRSFNVD